MASNRDKNPHPSLRRSALNVSYVRDLLQRHGSLSVESLLDMERAHAADVAPASVLAPKKEADSVAERVRAQHVSRLKEAMSGDAFESIFGPLDGQDTTPEQSKVAAYLSQVIVQAVNTLGSADHADEWLGRDHPTLGYQAPIELATRPFGFRLVTNILGAIARH